MDSCKRIQAKGKAIDATKSFKKEPSDETQYKEMPPKNTGDVATAAAAVATNLVNGGNNDKIGQVIVDSKAESRP